MDRHELIAFTLATILLVGYLVWPILGRRVRERRERAALLAVIERRESYVARGCPQGEDDPFMADPPEMARLHRHFDLSERQRAAWLRWRDVLNGRGVIVLTAGRKPWE